MQNIYAILAKYNLTIPEDKKTEFEEAVKANYKTVAEVEKITSARDNYKTQLETAQTALKEFEGEVVEILKKSDSLFTESRIIFCRGIFWAYLTSTTPSGLISMVIPSLT